MRWHPIRITTALAAAGLIGAGALPAQPINWAALRPGQRHLIAVTAGIDYGAVVGASYGYVGGGTVFTVGWSTPAGRSVADDFAGWAGFRTRGLSHGALIASTTLDATVRRYHSPFLRAESIGGDVAGVVGLYRRGGFVAFRTGFDWSAASHLVHSDLYRAQYPSVRDGWYRSTGGTFHYGLQAGLSFGRLDLHIDAGRLVERDLKSTPTVPLYLKLGTTVRLGG